MPIDELWPGGLGFIRSADVFALGTDSVMLSGFIDASNSANALDIGCGCGIISLLIAYDNPKICIDAIDIQQKAVDITSENAKLNGLDARIRAYRADIREHRQSGNAGKYDITFANPPYFPVNSGASSATESIATARDERTCTLEDLCTAAAYFTRWGGKFFLVHRPERLSEVLSCLSQKKLEPKRLRFVHDIQGSPPCLFLVESRRGGKPGLSIEAPLIIRHNKGQFTDEVLKIYHRKGDE